MTMHYLYDSYNLTGDPNETMIYLYGYDDFGRRISKASATGVDATNGILAESYVYDGFQVIGEYNTDGQHIKRRFIYAQGIDEPICMVVEPDHQGWYGLDEYSTIANSWLCDPNDTGYDSNADYYVDSFIDIDDLSTFVADYYLDDRPLTESTKYYGYVFDGSGNVVAMTFCNDPNETGNPIETPYFVESYTYDPFGVATIYDPNGVEISQSEIGNPYMFTARRFDDESGLYYYRLRMYNPEIGRFMQTDPIGYYDSMNLYQYCGNNPINWIDPWGLSFWDEIVFIAGGGFSGHGREVAGAVGSGIADGTEIFVNRAGFGLTDSLGWTNASQKIKENGGYGKASDILAGISRDAALVALGMRIRSGKELTFGKNFRFAPFGNATGHKYGRFPHYHRRGINPKNGITKPGQGIGRHRPWERKPIDRSWKDRY